MKLLRLAPILVCATAELEQPAVVPAVIVPECKLDQLEAAQKDAADCKSGFEGAKSQLQNLQSQYQELTGTVKSCEQQLTDTTSAMRSATAKSEEAVSRLMGEMSAAEAKSSERISALEATHKQEVERVENLLVVERSRSSELEAARSLLETRMTQMKNEVDTTSKEREKLREELVSVEVDLMMMKKEKETYVSEKKQLEFDRIQLEDDRYALESRIDQIESRIYSGYHFWLKYAQCKQIALAFIKFMKIRLQHLCGGIDLIEIATLQAKVWYQKITTHTHIIRTINATADYINPRVIHPLLHHLTPLWNTLLTSLDQFMNRIIQNLSTVDPSLQHLIPKDFNDRCYAFAFIFITFGAVSHLLQWLWNIIVRNPFQFFFRRNKAKKNTTSDTKKSYKITNAADHKRIPMSKPKVATKTKTTEAY